MSNCHDHTNSISCCNIYLKDLSGGDCEWACWEEVTRGRERKPADLHKD